MRRVQTHVVQGEDGGVDDGWRRKSDGSSRLDGAEREAALAAVAPPGPPPAFMPPPVLAQVLGLVEPRVVVALRGLPGVGKSAVAAAVAAMLVPDSGEGADVGIAAVVWLELGPQPDVDAAREKLRRAVAALGPSQIPLVVLDDVCAPADATAILGHAAFFPTILTARSDWHLPPATCIVALHPLPMLRAAQLLVGLWALLAPSHASVDAVPFAGDARVATLVRTVYGIPRAIVALADTVDPAVALAAAEDGSDGALGAALAGSVASVVSSVCAHMHMALSALSELSRTVYMVIGSLFGQCPSAAATVKRIVNATGAADRDIYLAFRELEEMGLVALSTDGADVLDLHDLHVAVGRQLFFDDEVTLRAMIIHLASAAVWLSTPEDGTNAAIRLAFGSAEDIANAAPNALVPLLISASNAEVSASDGREVEWNRSRVQAAILAIGTELLENAESIELKAQLAFVRGLVYEDQDNDEAALVEYEVSLDLTKQMYGENSFEVANALYNMALVYSRLGQHKNAMTANTHALQTYTALTGPHSATVINALVRMGNMFEEQKEFELALSAYLRAFDAVQILRGYDSVRSAGMLLNIGAVQLELKLYRDSLDSFDAAATVYAKVLDRTCPAVGDALYSKGIVLQDMKLYELARDAYREALAIRTLHYADDSLHVVLARSAVGEASFLLGDVDTGLPLLLSSLPTYFAEGDIERADEVLRFVIRIYHDRGDSAAVAIHHAKLSDPSVKLEDILADIPSPAPPATADPSTAPLTAPSDAAPAAAPGAPSPEIIVIGSQPDDVVAMDTVDASTSGGGGSGSGGSDDGGVQGMDLVEPN